MPIAAAMQHRISFFSIVVVSSSFVFLLRWCRLIEKYRVIVILLSCGRLYICFFLFWFEVKVIVKMFPVLWVVECGIVWCCCRRVFIDNFKFNYSELIFGDIPYLGDFPYGFKVLREWLVIENEHGIDILRVEV